MRRRRFCAGLGTVAIGILLGGCARGRIEPQATPLHPGDTEERLARLGIAGIASALIASQPQGEDLVRGLFVYSGTRRRNPTGALEVSYFLSPGYHRLDYRIFGASDAAQGDYARTVASFRDDPRGTPAPLRALPYPATILTYAEAGVTAVRVGQVAVAVIASGSNPRAVTALTLAGVAWLERVVAGAG
jgi:hypothetical protein